MFTSTLYKNEVIINDENFQETVTATEGMARGLQLDLRGPNDYEYDGLATPFPNELLINPSDYQAIIQEQEEQKSRNSDLVNLAGLPHKDQSTTNFCWINAPTHCVEVCYVQQNQRHADGRLIILSPASVGAKIKGYRNVGGWGKEGLDGIIKWGLAPVEMWPANAIDKKYDTSTTQQVSKKFTVDEWFECVPRNKHQMISMLLRRKPGAAGLNWWRHEVTYYECVWIDGEVAVRFRNSWKGYGDNGYSILQGSKMLADDLVFPSTAIPVTHAA